MKLTIALGLACAVFTFSWAHYIEDHAALMAVLEGVGALALYSVYVVVDKLGKTAQAAFSGFMFGVVLILWVANVSGVLR